VPADKPTVIEITEQLEPENRIRIIADNLPALPPAVEKVGADKYTGPGLVIQWVDVEGPLLESWPPPSHQAIFGDLKQGSVPSANEPHRLEVVSSQPMIDAERILHEFARRAFRPVTDRTSPFTRKVTFGSRLHFRAGYPNGLKAIARLTELPLPA
jgi:hypothetical protein